MKITEVVVKDLLTKSNLPASDYVINPYIGCPHACKYCYARFMKRFTGHTQQWGHFIDVKRCDKPINVKRLHHKTVFISSVTDCYNPYEETYRITRQILEQLAAADCFVTISTKSSLVLRDMDLLKQFRNLTVAISMNTLEDRFQKDMDCADSISERVRALEELHSQGIYTVLFMSPLFPFITDFRGIIEATKAFVCEYWFENLNLRGEYKHDILSYIAGRYPQYLSEYEKLYHKKDLTYWKQLADEIERYCLNNHIKYVNYFYHDMLVAQKKKK